MSLNFNDSSSPWLILHKKGETPKRVPRIDVEGWKAQGWSDEPEVEPEIKVEAPPETLLTKKPQAKTVD